MSVLEITRVDGCLSPVSVPVGEHFLGRGPLLKITDSKVSRKHAKINITHEGEVALTALHASPCFVKEQGGEWTSLEQHKTKRIKNNTQIKFTENVWHYKFSLVADKCVKADSGEVTHGARQEGSNKPTDSSIDVDSEPIQPSKNAIEELDLNTEAEPKGIRSLRKVLNKPSDLVTKTCDSLTELETTIDAENKGIRSLRTVLNKSPNLIKKNTSDSSTEAESSKLTTIEPEKSKPIATKSPKKRQLPVWLLKLTEENGIYPLHSSPKKRKLDCEDENTVVQKDSTPVKSPKRVKKGPPISTDSSLMTSTASTSKDDNPKSDAPDSCIVGNIQDATNHLLLKDFNKAKSPAKKNKFPVLVTPEDFEDSEDDGEKGNKVKQNKDTTKVREASRASCPHGASCYRKNPIHFTEEAHPGDPDFKDPDEVESDDDRPECEFGTNCYRKNPDHKRNFKHSHKPQPKRRVKAKNKKKAQADDDLDDSFIDDDSEDSIDDTDDDEDYEPEINSSQD